MVIHLHCCTRAMHCHWHFSLWTSMIYPSQYFILTCQLLLRSSCVQWRIQALASGGAKYFSFLFFSSVCFIIISQPQLNYMTIDYQIKNNHHILFRNKKYVKFFVIHFSKEFTFRALFHVWAGASHKISWCGKKKEKRDTFDKMCL